MFRATPAGVLLQVGRNLRSLTAVSFELRERGSDLRVSGTLHVNGTDMAAQIRLDHDLLDETGYLELIDGTVSYFRQSDSGWEPAVLPLGFATEERGAEAALEIMRYLSEPNTYRQWQVSHSRSGDYVLTGRVPGDLVAYLYEGLYGKQPPRFPPDGEFRLTVNSRTGWPTRLEVEASDAPRFRLDLTVELSGWNSADLRIPRELRKMVQWPF